MTEQIIPSDDVILKAVHDTLVISTTDLQGVITYANDLFCKLTGYSREELVGKPHNLVRHPSVPKEVYKDMWDTIQAGKIWTGVIPNVGKGGGIYVVDTTVQPIFDDAGKITGYISVRRVINDLMENFDAVELSKEVFDDYYDK
jgi:diguanylate cyclase